MVSNAPNQFPFFSGTRENNGKKGWKEEKEHFTTGFHCELDGRGHVGIGPSLFGAACIGSLAMTETNDEEHEGDGPQAQEGGENDPAHHKKDKGDHPIHDRLVHIFIRRRGQSTSLGSECPRCSFGARGERTYVTTTPLLGLAGGGLLGLAPTWLPQSAPRFSSGSGMWARFGSEGGAEATASSL